LSIDRIGNLYFTEYWTNKIARLNPSTGLFTEWAIPTPFSFPYSLAVDPTNGNVYFSMSRLQGPSWNIFGIIGRLVPSTNAFTEWPVPTGERNAQYITVNPSTGDLYFIESETKKIARMS
jgi:hypothetical protein